MAYLETPDGSFYELDADGFAVAAVDPNGNYFAADDRESAKLDSYVPRPEGDDRPWYERVAEYGLTRAIDSNFGPKSVNKTGSAATFAGQNGRTYSQLGANGQPVAPSGGIGGLLPLIVAGAVALFALS